MKLIKHELYKIFSKTFIFIVFSVFIIFLGGKILLSISNEKSIEEDYKRFDNMTVEEVEKEINKIKSLSGEDFDQKTLILDKCFLKYNENEKNKTIKVIDFNGLADTRDYTKDDIIKGIKNNSIDSYEYKKNLFIKEKSDSKNSTEYKYNSGYIIFEIQRVSLTLTIILVLISISSIFSSEYKNNMSFLILSSKYGRKKGVLAKIFSFIIVDTAFYTILNLLGVLIYKIVSGNKLLEGSYQDIFQNSYINSPLKSVYIRVFFMGLLALIAFTTIIALTSQITRNSLIPIFVGLFLQIFSKMEFPIKPILLLRTISFVNYGQGDLLNQLYLVNIFGSPMNLSILVTIMMLLIVLIGSWILIRINKNIKLA